MLFFAQFAKKMKMCACIYLHTIYYMYSCVCVSVCISSVTPQQCFVQFVACFANFEDLCVCIYIHTRYMCMYVRLYNTRGCSWNTRVHVLVIACPSTRWTCIFKYVYTYYLHLWNIYIYVCKIDVYTYYVYCYVCVYAVRACVYIRGKLLVHIVQVYTHKRIS